MLIICVWYVSVYVLCAYGDAIMSVLCTAKKLGILDGEHVFIAVDFDFSIDANFSLCDAEDVTTGKN